MCDCLISPLIVLPILAHNVPQAGAFIYNVSLYVIITMRKNQNY